MISSSIIGQMIKVSAYLSMDYDVHICVVTWSALEFDLLYMLFAALRV